MSKPIPSWSRDDVFPIIERMIRERYAASLAFIPSHDVASALLDDEYGRKIIRQAKRKLKHSKSVEWIAANMVAFFGKYMTDGGTVWGEGFRRRKIKGQWAYQPPVLRRRDIDRLVRFLRPFERPNREFATWTKGSMGKIINVLDGKVHSTMEVDIPHYDKDVMEFWRLMTQPCWRHGNYLDLRPAERIRDKRFIRRASLDECKALLTYCSQGEKWSGPGHMAEMLKTGKIQAILRRLSELRDTVDSRSV